jgi:hypothetical protein
MTSISLPPGVSADGPLRGAQAPRISHVPEYVTSSGREAVELAALAGLELDPWQVSVLTHALGERDDGRWAAFEVGLVVPRQNGKGSLLEARELAGLFLFGEKLLIHSAHEQATSSEHFRRLLNLIESVPQFEQRVLKAPRGKGAEAIELRGGQRIFFKTRTASGGRGLTGDFVALDEAMILPEATMEALVPTMAARSIYGNPQLWYAGSAVDQDRHEHGVVLARMRERGLKRVDRLAYFEWSAGDGDPAKDDPSDVPEEIIDDPSSWAQANPGMGIRIAEEFISNERAGALGARGFAVERLGIGDWPATDDNGAQVISAEVWQTLIDTESEIVGEPCFAFDVTPDRSRAAVAVAGRRSDGLLHVEIVEHRPGTDWVAGRVAELVDAHGAGQPVCDGAGPAASLIKPLQDRHVAVQTVTAGEHAQGCGMIFDAVGQGNLRHLGTPEMVAAIKGAVKRPLGDAWAWSRKTSAVDICPLVACTLALWGVAGGSTDTIFAWGSDGMDSA